MALLPASADRSRSAGAAPSTLAFGQRFETVAVRSACPTLGGLGAIAQLGERLLCKQEVTGSIPVGSTELLGAQTTGAPTR